MFFRLGVFFSAVFFSLQAAADCTGPSYLDRLSDAQIARLDAAVAALPYAEGLIWQARKDETTLTVVGTMHIYDPRLEALRAQVADTVKNADLVMLEATPEEEAKLQDMITTDPGRLFIVDGPTLPELVDEPTWEMIAQAANDRGIPGFMAAKMQPWYLSLTLAIPPCAMADMTSGLRGLDHMIIADAQAAGVPLQAVEDYTTLFDIFQNDTIAEQIDMLRLGLLAPDLQTEMFAAMLARYFVADIGRLWEMSRIALADTPGIDPAEGEAMFARMQEALLDQRNQDWMPVIRAAAQTHDDIVVAVGAAHLIGDLGILQLLENDGWTLDRLR